MTNYQIKGTNGNVLFSASLSRSDIQNEKSMANQIENQAAIMRARAANANIGANHLMA